jgi:hypothetical protein
MRQTNAMYADLASNFILIVQNKIHYLSAFNVPVDANNANFKINHNQNQQFAESVRTI